MIKPIAGSWFEFQHFCEVEGKYWNPTCAGFTDAQWEAKLEEMARIGMEYLVLTNVACHEKAFFKTSIFPFYPIKCQDPLEVVLSAADRLGMRFFIGIGFFTPANSPLWLINRREETRRRLQAINEIAEKYGHHKGFYGWYWPHEAFINNYFSPPFIQYVNTCSVEARRLKPDSKVLLGPYGTRLVCPDEKYIRQLNELDVDIIAYQDEVGVEKTRVEELPAIYEGLRKAHDRVEKVKMWMDVEVFQFEGKVYESALLPAPFNRVERQLNAASPFVERILIYQYLGLLNSPATKAFAGHSASAELYSNYVNWLEKNSLIQTVIEKEKGR